MKKKPFVHYEFPYVRFHGKFYPLIPITLKNGSRRVSTFALLDSGASVCVFRPEIAKALGLSLKSSPSIRLGTASGGVDVAMRPVTLEIQQTRFRSKVGFSNHHVATVNILGREGFFKNFSIAFNEIMKTVVLVPLEKLS